MSAPTIERAKAGAGHIGVAVAHWAGGHTVSEEEIVRRIVKHRQEAHAAAVADNSRQAGVAHRKATRLKRRAEENGGLVPAHKTALVAAELDAQRYDAAVSALGEFTVPILDPGQIQHRRHRIAGWRCTVLLVPVGGILAGSWLFSGTVFLFTVLGSVAACLLRGDQPFELTVRPVPAELIAATPIVLPTAGHDLVNEEPEALPVESGDWKRELVLYVEHAVAHADLLGVKGVHVVDLLAGLQAAGRYLGLTKATLPAKLRDAGIPVGQLSIKGDNQLGVRFDHLAQALGHSPRLPAYLVPDLTEREPAAVGETPSGDPSPSKERAA